MKSQVVNNLRIVCAASVALSAAAAKPVFGAGACLRVSVLSGTPSCTVTADEATCESVVNSVYFGDGTTCADVPDVYYTHPNGGQINISGATLFANFFELPGVSNDAINVDGDTIPCDGDPMSGFADTNCDTFPDGIDRLASTYTCGLKWHGQWLIQYRSVGSGNGLAEFVDYQLLGRLPSTIPTELGVLNGIRFAGAGVITPGVPYQCPANCFPPLNSADMDCNGSVTGSDIQGFIDAVFTATGCDIDRADLNEDTVLDILDVPQFIDCVLDGGLNCGRPINVTSTAGDTERNESNTPICPESIDIANMDVPTKWFVRAPGGSATWNRKPTSEGYGDNPSGSSDTGFSNKLTTLSRNDKAGNSVSLNVDTDTPDANTVYDTTVAYSPVVPIANRGTGLENVTFTDLQYALVTGRMPNGENLVINCRDVGSGTRNAYSNSLGVDPSFASGDNIGNQTTSGNNTNLGPNTRATQCGSSSHSENAAQQRRLCLGYTGIFGSDRAAADATAGLYEILNVTKDIAGGVMPVRCTVNSVLDNSDVDTGWQIGGSQTLATRGHFNSGVPGDPNELAPAMSRVAPRDYMRNLFGSIANYINSGSAPEFNSPAEVLVKSFILDIGVDATPVLTDPTNYQATSGFDQDIQEDVRALNTTNVPAFGSVFPGDGGRVPLRNLLSLPATYSDGSTRDYLDNAGAATIAAGQRLFPRMRIQGDFDADGDREVSDIAPMLAAIENPRAFSAADAAINPGNYIIPEILGDFDGDGNFNHLDIRYFGDGLALVGGQLDRKAGFIEIDEEWEATTSPGNYFFTDTTKVPSVTTLITGTYHAGDARGDVAGNAAWRGAQPHGQNFVVDHQDIEYVKANFFTGAWGGGLDDHFNKDLSCDMNGDRIVNNDDVVEMVEGILDTQMGDLDLNGVVDCGDLATLSGNISVITQGATYAQGDLDGDRDVDNDDKAIACANCATCLGTCCP